MLIAIEPDYSRVPGGLAAQLKRTAATLVPATFSLKIRLFTHRFSCAELPSLPAAIRQIADGPVDVASA